MSTSVKSSKVRMRTRVGQVNSSRQRTVSCSCVCFSPDCHPPTIYRLCSKVLQSQAGATLKSRCGSQCGHVQGPQAHEVVFILRRLVEQATEWQISFFVIGCDVAAAFDHVSHNFIIGSWRPCKSLWCWYQLGSENTGGHLAG